MGRWLETRLLEFQTRGEVSGKIMSGNVSQAPVGPVSLDPELQGQMQHGRRCRETEGPGHTQSRTMTAARGVAEEER